MKDPRHEKLARLLTEYSVALKPRDIVAIQGDACAAPLIRECYRAALRRGAFVITDLRIDGLAEVFMAEANRDQLKWISPFAKFKLRHVDALISFWGEENTKALTSVDPKRMAAASSARKPLNKIFMDRSASGALKWVGTQWPCNASAQDAEMSLTEYEEFVFDAGHLDARDPIAAWKRISKEQQALTDFLNKSREVRIVAEDTDIRYSCKGRKWINCDGHYNFPDGEVFTGPVENSVEGHVKFSFPAVHGGREVHGARLTFERGKVTKGRGGQGTGFPAGDDRDGQRVVLPRRGSDWHQLQCRPATRRTRCSTKRSAAPSISRLARGTAKPATRTAAACTGTWSAICARAANCTWTANSSRRTAGS